MVFLLYFLTSHYMYIYIYIYHCRYGGFSYGSQNPIASNINGEKITNFLQILGQFSYDDSRANSSSDDLTFIKYIDSIAKTLYTKDNAQV